MSRTVVRTTVVARYRSSLLVHETLFISASVAIRNSANGGKWTIRKINHPRTSGDNRRNSKPPDRSLVLESPQSLVNPRGNQHAQPQRRVKPGIPPLHRLEQLVLRKLVQEHDERVRLPPGFPLRGFDGFEADTSSFTLPMASSHLIDPSLCPGYSSCPRWCRLRPWTQHERRESNPQPPVLETGALPVELRS